MAEQCRTAAPSWKVTAWTDDNYIFIEIPSTTGNPYVQKYPINKGGLSKALNFLRVRYEVVPMAEKNYTKAPLEPGYVCQPLGASVVYRRQKTVVQTDEQRAVALNVLRKLGLV